MDGQEPVGSVGTGGHQDSLRPIESRGLVGRYASSGVLTPVFGCPILLCGNVYFVLKACFGCVSSCSSRISVLSHPRGSKSARAHVAHMYRHDWQTDYSCKQHQPYS